MLFWLFYVDGKEDREKRGGLNFSAPIPFGSPKTFNFPCTFSAAAVIAFLFPFSFTKTRPTDRPLAAAASVASECCVVAHVASTTTGLGKRVVPRLRELAPRNQMESGDGIHATFVRLFCPTLYAGHIFPLKVA